MQSACAVSYCHLWPARLYHIFPHYLIKRMLFGKKKVIQHKMCFLTLSAFFSNISYSKKKLATFYHTCAQFGMYNTRHSCENLIKLEFSRPISGKISSTRHHENPSSGSRVVRCGQTGRQTDRQTHRPDEANSLFRTISNARKNRVQLFL